MTAPDLVAEALVDRGVPHTTLTTRLDGITAANLRAAHTSQESGTGGHERSTTNCLPF
jgi:hypothetical protein